MTFPKPLALPKSIRKDRLIRQKELTAATRRGIYLRGFVIALELLGGYLLASASILADALSSSIDVLFSLVLLVAFRMAQRPPDEDHPFGHGRLEPLTGFGLSLVLTLLGGVLLFKQAFEAAVSTHTAIAPWAWLVPGMAVLLMEICFRFTQRAATRHKSAALLAEAWHYRADALTSLVAMLALVTAGFWPDFSGRIDHLGACAIAIFMLVIGIRSGLENIHQLMDRSPEPELFERVAKAALSCEGVLGTEKIRIQSYGPDAHVDIDVEVDPAISVHAAHEISQVVRRAIQLEWPAVRDVTVHIEPYYPNDH